MSKTPLYLRDLKPEYQQDWIRQIKVNPELAMALAAEEDIIVGYYIDKPKAV